MSDVAGLVERTEWRVEYTLETEPGLTQFGHSESFSSRDQAEKYASAICLGGMAHNIHVIGPALAKETQV